MPIRFQPLPNSVLRLAGKGMSLRGIAKAMTRSEESIQAQAKEDGLKGSKLRVKDFNRSCPTRLKHIIY